MRSNRRCTECVVVWIKSIYSSLALLSMYSDSHICTINVTKSNIHVVKIDNKDFQPVSIKVLSQRYINHIS
jgi:hypothetical protein